MTPKTALPASRIAAQIATDIGAAAHQVNAVIRLLDEGSTVPFIARYRKEATGGLDDVQLRHLQTRLDYLRNLEDRRAAILASIVEQGRLDDTLRANIEAAVTKARLEDLYLPFKPKRRTLAMAAREAGLEALLDELVEQPNRDPNTVASGYVSRKQQVSDAAAALTGARHILIERAGEHADLIGELRDWLAEIGQVRARVIKGKDQEGAKYRDYFDHAEPLSRIPSHRLLALLRARSEGILRLELAPGKHPERGHEQAVARIARRIGIAQRNRRADAWLFEGAQAAWKTRLHKHLSTDLLAQARERAETEAIQVFSDNLKDLLLAAPAGPRVVMGLDPGLRTGVKVAVVDRNGKLVDTATVYPHPPHKHYDQTLSVLARLSQRHQVELIAIGNGTASRETDRLAGELLKKLADPKIQKLIVSEAGASVYSASELASRELPDLDVSLRGAVSIARRLQDPLAELVKIEPRAIGVGQYQHDLDQARLSRALDARVEDCVNAVGVNVNTASPALLARISGLSPAVAENIVRHKEEKGAFGNRRELLEVPRLGPRAFEQAAGFLRIPDSDNPLDASAVHPEAYAVVKRMLKSINQPIKKLVGDRTALRSIQPDHFVDAQFGLPTIRDILKELEKPGRDPRPEFRTAKFASGVETLADLTPGMILEGTVSNVTAFGAFVDIGVHQDGLVHISALSNKFIKDPREVVKAGDIVKVKVLNTDIQRKRIALTLRLDDPVDP